MSVLDASWIMDVAAGNAPQAVCVLAACHAELNPKARTRLNQAEAVMGTLLEQAEPSPLTRLQLSDLDLETPPGLPPSKAGSRKSEAMGQPVAEQLPPSLRYQMQHASQAKWRKQAGGIRSLGLDHLSEEGVKARLLCLPAGQGVASHTHGDQELTLVLSGGFYDGQAAYHAGDVCEAGPDLIHAPRAFSEEDCLCLAVELGPLSFTHPFLAFADRILGWSRS